MNKKYEIKCGSCGSEYNPRLSEANNQSTSAINRVDYSCPVCGHGKMLETKQFLQKAVLLKD